MEDREEPRGHGGVAGREVSGCADSAVTFYSVYFIDRVWDKLQYLMHNYGFNKLLPDGLGRMALSENKKRSDFNEGLLPLPGFLHKS